MPIRISPENELPARNTPAPDDTAAVDTHRNYAVAPILGGVELLSAVYRNHRFAPHSQDAAVIGVVEQGRAVVFGGGQTLTLEKGSVLIIPPHVLHDAYSLGDGEWHYRALYLNRSQIAELTPDARVGQGVLGTRPIVLQTADVTNRVLAVHESLSRASEHSSVPVLDDMRALLQALDAHVVEGLRDPFDVQRVSVGIARVRRLLDDDPLPKRSLSSLAAIAGVNRFTFAHAFSRAYGVSPHAYALQRRVTAVRDLLMAGELVSRAAHHVGFADQSHLTRRFISVVGVTPGEFRRAWRQISAHGAH